MRKNLVARNTLFILIVIYFLQGTIFQRGSYISQLVYILIIIISSSYIFSSLRKSSKVTYKFLVTWFLFYTLIFLSFLLSGELNDFGHLSMAKGALFNFVLFYPCFYFSYSGSLDEKSLSHFCLIMLPVFILNYNLNEANILVERISLRDNVVNNVSYFFVGLIPFLFFFERKKIISYSVLATSLFFIVLSAKRGAFLSGTTGFLFFIFYDLFKGGSKNLRTRILTFIFVPLFSLLLFNFLFDKANYLITRIESVADLNSSGRDFIIGNILDNWISSHSLFNYIFGFGFASTLKLSETGNYAHNDWVEVLCNFGILGLTLFFLKFVFLIKASFEKKLSIKYRFVLVCVLVVIFINTLFYRFYSGIDSFLYSIILGYLLGTLSKNEKFYFQK